MRLNLLGWTASAMAAGMLLISGCNSPEEKSAPESKPATKADAKTLNVYMWSEYIDPELPAEFEKQTGIPVRIDVYESTEEMIAKIGQAGGSNQYDVVVVADHGIPILVKQGLLRELDKARIPNAVNISDQFANPGYDPGQKHSIPYQWGTMGLMYRKDRHPGLEASWSVVFDEAKQPGPFLLIDSMRDMMAAALKSDGKSINTRNIAELQAAGEAILKAKHSSKCVGFEGSAGGKNKVVAGVAELAIVYNGEALRAMEEDPNTAFLLPEEGTLVWVDAMTIPKGAPNPDGAHAFINFILDPDVGAKLSNFNRFASPNKASLALISEEDRNNPAIYPPQELIDKMEYLEDVGAETRMYDEVWTAVKSR